MIGQALVSWVDVEASSDFPLQNLPLGRGSVDNGTPELVSRIGEMVVRLSVLKEAGLLPEFQTCWSHLSRAQVRTIRLALAELLQLEARTLRDNIGLTSEAMVPVSEVTMVNPMPIGHFVDFYSGIHHASNVGKMFRPDMPSLLPNYRHLPVGYNGRASTVFPSGTPVVRPKGQQKPATSELPIFGPTQELDFELEVGFLTCVRTAAGDTISLEEAEQAMSGLVLVNDWSARDLQRWEYQPLGPFLAKSFATSISPWIVTLDALEPFRIKGSSQDPPVLPYLNQPGAAHFDINLEVWLTPRGSQNPERLSVSNTGHLYWSFAQQLAHQTSNGTPIEPGELYASGTISGPEPGQFGSMLELTWNGTQPIRLQESGQERVFLQDGDTVTFRAYAEREGLRIGFGEVGGTVLPARS